MHGTWGGYLQPAQIVQLADSGLVQPNNNYIIEWSRKYVTEGKCNRMWFYFQPKPEFLELHRGLHRG